MSLLSRIFGKNPKCTKNALQIVLQGISAERTRFELVVRNDPYVGLANRWFQTLTHLSKHERIANIINILDIPIHFHTSVSNNLL